MMRTCLATQLTSTTAVHSLPPDHKLKATRNLKQIGGSLSDSDSEANNAALLGATCELPADLPVKSRATY